MQLASFAFVSDCKNFLHQVSHTLKLKFWRKAVQAEAEIFEKALKEMPRLPPSEGLKHRTIREVRGFLKTINKRFLTDEKVKRCFRHYLAAKIGVHFEAFDKNPGLETFARQTHLEQYLKTYEDQLQEDPDHCVRIKYQGNYSKWEDVKKEYDSLSFPVPKNPNSPKSPWIYGEEGIQREDLYAWSEWKPFMQRPNPSGKFFFEYCAICESSSIRLSGDHTWLRLIDADGNVYSVGKNLDSKIGGSWFQLPLRKRKGYLQSPDVSEFWPLPVYTLAVEITQEHFEKIKKSVEEDKKNEKDQDLQVMGDNCLEFVNKKGVIAGFKLQTSHNVLRMVTPLPLQKIYDFSVSILPPLAVKVLNVVGAFFANLILLILGNGSVDNNMKNRVKSRPQLNSLSDLFKPSKLEFHPPTHLAHDVIKQIEEWRDTEILKHPENEEKIRYALPSECLKTC